jgi:prepilin-type processing-associated H-X9-DG protein/prepilin-type N-terminal cleavage/methylation domain-containing protein
MMTLRGFTLVELLVVIFTLAVLAVMVLPALAATTGREKATSCLNNLRQLQIAYHLYAGDYNDLMVTNQKSSDSLNNWAAGIMNGPLGVGGSITDPTNILLLEESLLYPYCRNVGIYKCPADTGPNPQLAEEEETIEYPCRSYSVNTYMNGYDVGATHQDDWPTGTYIVQTKLSMITSPGPAKRIVFADESQDSIDDGNLSVVPSAIGTAYTPVDVWWNWPTARHGNGAGFSYADGHATDISWLGTQLQTWEAANVTGSQPYTTLSGNDLADLRTVQAGIALPNGQN